MNDINAFWIRYDCDRLHSLDNFGQSSVYPATDKTDNSRLAAKIAEIHIAFDDNKQWGSRYTRAILEVNHPNCIQYQQIFHSNLDNISQYALLMPLYSHGSLLHSNPHTDWTEAQRHHLFLQTANALHYLHSKGFVLQNLHASHILIHPLDNQYEPVLINYAQTQRLPLAFIHNYEYLAPEQFAPDYQPQIQTDIWALGVLGYYIWTGQLPFGKKAPQMPNRLLQQRILNDELPDLIERIPAPYQQIIAQCLHKDPNDRWASAQDVAQRLPAPPPPNTTPSYVAPESHTLIEQDSEDAPRPLWQRRFRRRPSKPINPLIVLLLLALAAALGLLLNRL